MDVIVKEIDIMVDDPFDTVSPRKQRSNPVINGRYRLPDPDPGLDWPQYKRIAKDGSTSWMRATRLAGAIADSYALSTWQQRKLAHGLVVRPSLYSLAATLDPDNDKDEYDALCERAKDASNTKESADYGTALHAFTEQIDRGESPPIPEIHKADVRAWTSCLAKHNIEIVSEYIERIIVVDFLGVAGRIDRVGTLQKPIDIVFPDGVTANLPSNTRVIVDLKTGRDLQYAWHEIAIQLAIYANMSHVLDEDTDTYRPPPSRLSKQVAFVIHLPVGLGKATLHAINLDLGKKGMTLAKKVLDWRTTKGLSIPVRPPQDRAREERNEAIIAAIRAVRTAPNREALSTLYQALVPRGLWTEEIAEAALKRQALLDQRSRCSGS